MRALNPRIPRLAALLPLFAGCAGTASRAPGGPTPWSTACILSPPPEAGGTTATDAATPIRVALPDPLDDTRSLSADAGARVVLRQLYQTLVEVDCEGRARPGLARSWSHDDEGRRWRFTLRPDARFWDGAPVTAEAVAHGWLSGDGPAAPRPGVPRIVSASVTGPLELSVVLRDPTRAPERFARVTAAVTGEGRVGGWPMGSGAYRPVTLPTAAGEVALVAAAGDPRSPLAFVVQAGGDGRAALDAGADVLVTADPAVLAYARALPGLSIAALPWSRTYVLAAAESDAWGQEVPPTAPAEALEGLARGAVRADARPALAPFWWHEGGCGGEAVTPGSAPAAARRVGRADPGARARVAYPRGDAVAREIAERLVALAGRGSAVPAWLVTAVPGLPSAGGDLVAAGLDPAALARAARDGDALAFVAPVPRAPGGACTSSLLAAEDEVGRALFAPDSGLRLTPLVDVRPSLILRQGVGGIALDGDGTLRFIGDAAVPPAGSRP